MAVEEAFKNLKGDLAIRPIFHQRADRIEAHVLVSFLAYCVHVSLREKLRRRAPGLTARSVLEKFGSGDAPTCASPTTDGRELIFARYTQPEAEQENVAGPTGTEVASTIPTPDHGKKRSANVGQTFESPELNANNLPSAPAASS